MKKILCVIMASVMLLAMAACGETTSAETTASKAGATETSGSASENETTGPAETVPTTEPVDNRPVITVGIPVSANVVSLEDNYLTQWIGENLGVRLEFTEYVGGSEIGVQLTTTVNAGQSLPDILYGIDLDDEKLAQCMKDGYFWDLTPYFDDKEGATANFWSRITESLTEEQQASVVETITDPATGKVYGVPTVETTGNATEVNMTCKLNTFISKDCEDPDTAFEILMLLWSWEGSMRVRYGEYGANWEDADEGAKSEAGLDATFKLIVDPMTEQNTSHWGTVACCFIEYANGETAQVLQ